jgi:ribosome-binding protein aMBF1 (putative translation factor)
MATMIKNERQYRITKAQAEKFAAALHEMTTTEKRAHHPLLRQAQIDALHSQLEELQRDVADYEALQSGKQKVVALDSWEALPRTLIQARIAAGLTQEELAAKLGLKPQQIQRYEATDYQSASLERITEILRVLGVKLRQPAELRLAAEFSSVG